MKNKTLELHSAHCALTRTLGRHSPVMSMRLVLAFYDEANCSFCPSPGWPQTHPPASTSKVKGLPNVQQYHHLDFIYSFITLLFETKASQCSLAVLELTM